MRAKGRLATILLSIVLIGLIGGAFAQSRSAVCYNCPPEWADWAGQLRSIREHLGINVPHDNKNSGQALSQLIAERNNPVADVVYYGVNAGIQAAREGVIEPYRPVNWEEIPEGLKDPEGLWFTIHYGTLGFFVNVDALEGAPVPQSWEDLLDPQYRGMVGYLDPSSAAVGYAGAVAVNQALGGDFEDFTPAIDYFRRLAANDPIVPLQTSYARVLSGEIPILLDYDFNAYRAKYNDEANVEFVIPQEGTIIFPYVMSLVRNSSNSEEGREILDHVLSDEGQAVWANAFLRPIRPGAMTPEIAALFLPEEEYERAVSVDYALMAERQEAFVERYLQEVR